MTPIALSYQDLLLLADLSSVYIKTKPLLISKEHFNNLAYTKHDNIRIFDEKNQKFHEVIICSDNSIYYLIQLTEPLIFIEGSITHQFHPYDIILLSAGNNTNFKHWHFEKVSDILELDTDFIQMTELSYENEQKEIDNIKYLKTKRLKEIMENSYAIDHEIAKKDTFKKKLSILFKVFFFKKIGK